MSLLNILNAIPAAASRFGGSVIQQAPKAAARVPQAARSAGFDPLNQVPAFFSRFGGSVIQQAPSARNLPSLRGIMPVAGAGMAGFSGAALDPLLKGSQYVQQQLQGFGAAPRVGQTKSKPTEGYSSYGTYTVGGIEYDINSGRPTYMPPGSVYPSSSVAPFTAAKQSNDPAAERAYQSEKASIAQQAAQNPELQRYEKQRTIAAASGDQAQMDAARDLGMQMWAKANPTLAAKVKPGQSGYDAIQGNLAGQAAAQGYGYQMPQQILMTPPPGVNTPQGLPAVQSFGPTSTYGAEGLDIDPEMRQKFQALLNQAKG